MNTVDRIFAAFGEHPLKVVATETGVPMQTACDWRKKGNIPHWRRAAVLDAAKRKGIRLAPDLLAFLGSDMPADKWDAAQAEAA